MSLQAFGPRGPTCNINCSDTASAPVQVTASGQSCYTYQFMNIGASKCYFNWAASGGGSVSIPVSGTPSQAIPVLANEIVIYNLTPGAWITAICESGETTNLLVTPGEGM